MSSPGPAGGAPRLRRRRQRPPGNFREINKCTPHKIVQVLIQPVHVFRPPEDIPVPLQAPGEAEPGVCQRGAEAKTFSRPVQLVFGAGCHHHVLAPEVLLCGQVAMWGNRSLFFFGKIDYQKVIELRHRLPIPQRPPHPLPHGAEEPRVLPAHEPVGGGGGHGELHDAEDPLEVGGQGPAEVAAARVPLLPQARVVLGRGVGQVDQVSEVGPDLLQKINR